MKRRDVLGLLLLGGPLSRTIGAFQQPAGRGGQPQGPPTVEAEKLSDTLVLLRGGGGTTAVLLRGDGVTVVDTKNPNFGAPIMAAIKELTGRPITTIINTHCHGDHVSGNVEFPANIEIVAQAVTEANMTQMRPVTGLPAPAAGPSIFERNNGKGLPTRTFTDRLTLGSGDGRIELHYFGRAHTGGDAFVVFPALRVMHTGDAFHTKDLPIMDANNGGSGVEYSGTLAKAAAAATGIDRIINGHHPTTTTVADLRMQSEFVADFVTFVQAAKRGGKTLDDVVSTWRTPAKYVGYTEPNPTRVRADAQVIWDETP
jgi:glyoxylase-like metal-dependent hydrolase (beta-lactamase superfamily II)